jgi:DNA-binding response OmpR family regulator
MPSRAILVIEDDPAIRRGIVDVLKFERFDVLEAADGDNGLKAALTAEYDLLLLDLVLPGRDGLDLLAELRAARPAQPVIILTARGDESDRVRGLRLGADDYVVKPFSVKELLARVNAVLRRSPARPDGDMKEIPFPSGRVDIAKRAVLYHDGKREELSEREAALLAFLARRPGRPVSRDEIMAGVWRVDPKAVETRTIDMHIARLREKLRDDAEDPKIIKTLRGKGYVFETQQPEKKR